MANNPNQQKTDHLDIQKKRLRSSNEKKNILIIYTKVFFLFETKSRYAVSNYDHVAVVIIDAVSTKYLIQARSDYMLILRTV